MVVSPVPRSGGSLNAVPPRFQEVIDPSCLFADCWVAVVPGHVKQRHTAVGSDASSPKQLIEHTDTAVLNAWIRFVQEFGDPFERSFVGHNTEQFHGSDALFQGTVGFTDLVTVLHGAPGMQEPQNMAYKLGTTLVGKIEFDGVTARLFAQDDLQGLSSHSRTAPFAALLINCPQLVGDYGPINGPAIHKCLPDGKALSNEATGITPPGRINSQGLRT
jgi:hypothetical protein